MKIIFISDRCRRTASLDLCLARTMVVSGLVLACVTAAGLWGGFLIGQRNAAPPIAMDVPSTEILSLLEAERQAIADARSQQRAHTDVLALRIAEIQGHLMRLNALGDRLVEVGNLDRDEFDFASSPPVGGVDDALSGETQDIVELSVEMSRISALLDDREDKLAAMEQLLTNRELMAAIKISGRPVKKGWMSSAYGKRTDPFKGKKSFHRGLDFAGKPGADVIAVASGVVSRAEKVDGYGNVVEIKHANGYSTLYAHNKENLVKVGDMVGKGQTIALLGSTGRSSGPHVHFEVHRDGKHHNPLRFVGKP